MQTMPSKKNTTTLVTGAAVLVLVVGLIAYGINQNAKNEVQTPDPMAEVAAPENGNAAQPGSTLNAGAATPDSGITQQAGAVPVTETPSATAVEVEDQPASSPALNTVGAVPDTHVVQPNETLRSIAKMYYNDPVYAGDIEQLNGITDPNQIMVGQELQLPRPEALATTTTAE